MKKRAFIFMSAITIAAAIYAMPLYAQQSQTLGVNIPFAFTTNGKTMPAGHYRIEGAGDSRRLWRIRGLESQSGGYLLALNLTGSNGRDSVVTFHRYGENYFLAGFVTGSYDISLPVSKREKKTRLAGDPMAQMQVVEVKTTLGGSR
jgi:hypothetical protein